MTFPIIGELPEPPRRNEPEGVFVPKSNAFLASFPQMRIDFNAAGEYVEDKSAEVGTRWQETELNAQSAALSASSALVNASFKGEWYQLSGPLNTPASVLHNGKRWQLLQNLDNVTLYTPGISEKWEEIRNKITEIYSMADLKSYGIGRYDGQQVDILGFYPDTPGSGGGSLYWDATRDKTDHNGGTIIDPTHSATPGADAWYSAENTGVGCWTRKKCHISSRDYGLKELVDSHAVFAAMVSDNSVKNIFIPPGEYYSQNSINIENRSDLNIFSAIHDSVKIKYTGTYSTSTTLNFIRIADSNRVNLKNIIISGGASDADDRVRSLLFVDSNDVVCERLKFTDFTTGAFMAYRSSDLKPRVSNISISDSIAYGGTSFQSDVGFLFVDCVNCRMDRNIVFDVYFYGHEFNNLCENCHGENNQAFHTGAAFAFGSDLEGDFTKGPKDCSFINSLAVANQGNSLVFEKGQGCLAEVDIEIGDIIPDPSIQWLRASGVYAGPDTKDATAVIKIKDVPVNGKLARINGADNFTLVIDNVYNSQLDSAVVIGSGTKNSSVIVNNSDPIITAYKTFIEDTSGFLTNKLLLPSSKYAVLTASGTDFRDYYGTDGHSGGSNYHRVSTSTTSTDLLFLLDGSTQLQIKSGVSVTPGTSGLMSNGSASKLWSEIFAVTGTINTSDDRKKHYIDISDQEKQCAIELKQNMKKYKLIDAIARKGEDSARIHFGASAQTVADIFTKHGLDANKYGLFCYNSWCEVCDDGETINAGDSFGLRYEELLCFIIAAS